MQRIKVGVVFGGPSREREISFAGGRTVYDNLDSSLFEAVPIFVDSYRQFILLDWQYVYKGSIRDFYPPVSAINDTDSSFQIYAESLALDTREQQAALGNEIGEVIDVRDLKNHIDVAFLTLHGEFGEDGQIQAIFDSMGLPYTGSGVLPSAIGIDKSVQKQWMQLAGFPCPKSMDIRREEWLAQPDFDYWEKKITDTIGNHIVIRPAHQGSSIGVSIIENPKANQLKKNIDAAFFIDHLTKQEWQAWDEDEKQQWIRKTIDIRDGIGLPLTVDEEMVFMPADLIDLINSRLKEREEIKLIGVQGEEKVLLEDFLNGKEFSCVVLRMEDGKALALPPTEIVKGSEVFDYRSKYLPGLSRKLTPINLDIKEIEKIQSECVKLFELFGFHTYARIDGFFQEDGTVFLNDPNTTSGMLPSSFFFHQAAELGLNPSQLITFIIRQSIAERIKSAQNNGLHDSLLSNLDQIIQSNKMVGSTKKRIGVILGGYSFERHISVESGRNIFEKLSSSEKYEAIPIFLRKEKEGYSFHQLPINLLLKDNADDISDKTKDYHQHELIDLLRTEGSDLLDKYINETAVLKPVEIRKDQLKDKVDAVFIALHGRPGEDGEIQQFLDAEGIPYNGSGPTSSAITIHKFNTLQLLKQNGFIVTDQKIVTKSQYEKKQAHTLEDIESNFQYPLIVKPVDDGCSSAVMIVKERSTLEYYFDAIFREEDDLSEQLRKALGLSLKEEFPIKQEVLIEQKIERADAQYFLEITGGLLTRKNGEGLEYEIFEPSEALAGEDILSLEEKFLAGEGQNITPARFGKTKEDYERISSRVKADFEKAARILNIEGYARIDAFVRVYEDRVETIIIEVNSLPGMTPATCIFHQTALKGYKPFEFIDNILTFAFENR